MPAFYIIFAQKNIFPEFWETFAPHPAISYAYGATSCIRVNTIYLVGLV